MTFHDPIKLTLNQKIKKLVHNKCEIITDKKGFFLFSYGLMFIFDLMFKGTNPLQLF